MANEETKPLKVVDYIDRFKVLELLKRYADLFAEPPVDRKELELVLEIKFEIERLKSADAKEVQHGHWISLPYNPSDPYPYECSICGVAARRKYATCCRCGAKMDVSKVEITTE